MFKVLKNQRGEIVVMAVVMIALFFVAVQKAIEYEDNKKQQVVIEEVVK